MIFDLNVLSILEVVTFQDRGGGILMWTLRPARYVGNTIVYAGQRKERDNCKQYMKWLFQQLDGPVQVDTRDRDDVRTAQSADSACGYCPS